jgi:hypothetical protein
MLLLCVDQHISRYCSIIGETEYLVKKKCKRNKVQKNKKTLETREDLVPPPPPPNNKKGISARLSCGMEN